MKKLLKVQRRINMIKCFGRMLNSFGMFTLKRKKLRNGSLNGLKLSSGWFRRKGKEGSSYSE